MNHHRVLFTGAMLTPSCIEWMQQHKLDVEVCRSDLSETELACALVDKDAYILGGVEHASAAVLSTAATRLKVVAFLGVGYHAFIDTEAATAAGIAITNAPGANARAVAEFTIGLMLDAWRKVTYLAQQTKAGRWCEVKGRNLDGKTLGIVGMGTIGSMVARIAAKGLGMRVLYMSRTPKLDLEEDIAACQVGLSELLAESDVVSLHAAYGPQTDRIIGEAQLATVKPGAILINTSEAELVDAAALRMALVEGRLAAAAMDGYYIEPVPSIQADPYGLLALGNDRLLITPHTANATEESFLAMLTANVESITNILETGDDSRIVNPGFRNHASWLPLVR
ncbi:D-isomer specific 2-hydroxyacid dehydrogenase family protein [Nocardia transvalensis]|uniref:D-isomer specific 2-hydroxyacid dehydrogenase family protein n=1 Tax=Nocardia transvalensis TaxID=37333 RepID=UPI0018931D61|nr:D-isomer specific 2-hydroxyacid dehydrogenase family protein [Nocardia transvalensis]MBF6332423.1 3-phosphoglycerate dehydrogenase [Nocardia transvalensis]